MTKPPNRKVVNNESKVLRAGFEPANQMWTGV